MAKKDTFQLQPVLWYKEKLEETRRQELAELQEDHRRQLADLLELQRQHIDHVERLRDRQSRHRLDVEYILQEMQFLTGIARAVEIQAQRVEEAGKRVEDKRLELVGIAQEKKMLEKLKDKQHLEFLDAQKKEEAKQVDEIVTTRFSRNLPGHV